jgi:hypothetical protein
MKNMQLSEFPKKVRYTMTEYHLFATLPKNGKKIGSIDIAEARGDDWDVKFPMKNVTVTMNRLIDKIDLNKEPFKICKTEKAPGQRRVEYWLEARKRNGR